MARKIPAKGLAVGIIGIAAVIIIAGNAIGLPIPDFFGISDIVAQTTEITSTIYGENTGQAALLPGCAETFSCSVEVTFECLEETGNCPVPDELPPVVSSNDTTTQQQADTFDPPILGIVSEIVKIDSDGKRDVDFVTIGFLGQLSLTEPGVAIDYSTGFINIDSLTLFGGPLADVSGAGSFDVLINNSTIFAMPFGIEVDRTCPEGLICIDTLTGKFDGNGTVRILFVEPTGAKAPSFSFSFADNIVNFPNFQISELRFVISNFVITTIDPEIACIAVVPTPAECLPKQWALVSSDLLTLQMNNDPSKIVIVDEATGENINANLVDNNLVISTLAKSIAGDDCIVSPPLGNVFLRIKNTPVGVKIFSGVGEGMKDISVSPPNCFATFPTASTTLIQRNTDYVLEFSDPNLTFQITTAQSQQDYHFSCQYVNASKLEKICNFPP